VYIVSAKGCIKHSLVMTALCLCHHFKWIGVLLWGKSQQETTENSKTAIKSAVSQIQATAISIYRLPAPGTERNLPKSVGLDKLAMVMAD
jgi:hypothetical protein